MPYLLLGIMEPKYCLLNSLKRLICLVDHIRSKMFTSLPPSSEDRDNDDKEGRLGFMDFYETANFSRRVK